MDKADAVAEVCVVFVMAYKGANGLANGDGRWTMDDDRMASTEKQSSGQNQDQDQDRFVVVGLEAGKGKLEALRSSVTASQRHEGSSSMSKRLFGEKAGSRFVLRGSKVVVVEVSRLLALLGGFRRGEGLPGGRLLGCWAAGAASPGAPAGPVELLMWLSSSPSSPTARQQPANSPSTAGKQHWALGTLESSASTVNIPPPHAQTALPHRVFTVRCPCMDTVRASLTPILATPRA
ncbi:hypothetical protein E4U54_002039 [Claviceps lovelessii]|nr:hypothetical protein E4U54_002039 [Claviceps lovelessii]